MVLCSSQIPEPVIISSKKLHPAIQEQMWRPPAKHLVDFRESQGRGGGRITGARGLEDTTKTQPIESTNQVHGGSQRLKPQSGSPDGSDPGPLHMCYGYVACCSCRLLKVGAGPVSESFTCFWVAFLSTALPRSVLVCG